MIHRIILENFMAHERTELELGPGITALTGANNTGKSAVVEALRCVTTNPSFSHCIRHGAREARVTVVLDDGAKVVWIRKKRSAGYEITLPGRDEPEEPFWKLQGKVPDEVRALLRLNLVELETGDPVDVHLGNQREPVFLLNRPESNVAAFFAASTESAHLLAMQNALKARTTEAKRRERDLEAERERIEVGLDALASLPDIALRMEEARQLEDSAKELQVAMPVLESRCSSLRGLAARRGVLRRVLVALNSLEPVPNSNPIDGLRSLAAEMARTAARLADAGRAGAALADLAAPPATENTARLAELCKRQQAAACALRKAEVKSRCVDGLLGPPDTVNTAHLSEVVDEMIASRYRMERVARRDKVLRSLAEPPRVEEDAHLLELVAGLRGLTMRRQTLEAALSGLEMRLQETAETLAGVLADIGGCPLCGARINAETFLDRGHGHEC
ncbi:AAA family ATPase [Pseudodesulfovibrio sp. F-1]|uniref:AAA family ATPase n=1 Tax=Pseudodesulfovibrio alkaliphilus TaxID=2661613 RepID=A0A7K1KMS1_9BACT|nr:AAA family ATPase [Pseudodesulfovibrio alkaliphilus]MUM77383.1 AAA family ATPase [Pseudodesulfovibrio alkaliphilus]